MDSVSTKVKSIGFQRSDPYDESARSAFHSFVSRTTQVPIVDLAMNLDQSSSAADMNRENRWLRAILDTAVEGIVAINEQGIIISINPAARAIFGYQEDELLGKNVRMLMPEPYHSQHDQYLANYHSTGNPHIIGIGREVHGKRKDGSTFPLELSVAEVELADGRFYTGIVRDITERRRLEKQVLAIAEQEQQRIGQDIHDGLCQHLAGIEFMSQVLHQTLQSREAPEAGAAEEIANLIRQATQLTRQISHGLSPIQLNAEGLMNALRQLCSSTSTLFQLQCEFHGNEPPIEDNVLATHLYRITQEAISNAIRHGKASHIMVKLSRDEQGLELKIGDNGLGIKDSQGNHSQGMGLQIMSYRANMIGGDLSIKKNAPCGTIVLCRVDERHITPNSSN